MGPLVVNGQLWRVAWVEPGDPRLVVGGIPRLGSTYPAGRAVYLRRDLKPPLLDRVALHEAAHAVATAHGTGLGSEIAAMAVELHGLEAAHVASEMLGRKVCVRGFCS